MKRFSWFRIELALFVALLGLFSWQIQRSQASNRAGGYIFTESVVDARSYVMERFVREPDEQTQQRMQEEAIRGMLKALDDPYTTYYSPEKFRDFEERNQARLYGVGIRYQYLPEQYKLEIISPMASSPAIKAGLKHGDLITHVNGESIADIARKIEAELPNTAIPARIDRITSQIENMIKGPRGSQVTLRVEHEGQAPKDVQITRDLVPIQTVKGWTQNQSGQWSWIMNTQSKVAYVKLTQFSSSTINEFNYAMRVLTNNRARGLILDLRDNPGGSLKAAIELADMFLDQGLIIYTRGRKNEVVRYMAKPGVVSNIPILILINGRSASASEILAGALQEHQRAVVMGTRSLGKGSIQLVVELDNNMGGLKLTTSLYYLPVSHRSIQRKPNSTIWGIDPNPGYMIPMSRAEELLRLKARAKVEIIDADSQPAGQKNITPDVLLEEFHDAQLSAAYQSMILRIDSGTFAPSGSSIQSQQVTLKQLEVLERERERLQTELNEINQQIEEMMQNSRTTTRPDETP